MGKDLASRMQPDDNKDLMDNLDLSWNLGLPILTYDALPTPKSPVIGRRRFAHLNLRGSGQQLEAPAASGPANQPNLIRNDVNEMHGLKVGTETFMYYFQYLNARIEALEMRIQTLYDPQIMRGLPQMGLINIRRVDLDQACNPVWAETPEPTNLQLQEIATILEGRFGNIGRKELISNVRKWFRKRREELGIKLLNSFKEIYKTDLLSPEKSASIKLQFEDNTIELDEIIEGAKLAVPDNAKVRKFCREKLLNFMERH